MRRNCGPQTRRGLGLTDERAFRSSLARTRLDGVAREAEPSTAAKRIRLLRNYGESPSRMERHGSDWRCRLPRMVLICAPPRRTRPTATIEPIKKIWLAVAATMPWDDEYPKAWTAIT